MKRKYTHHKKTLLIESQQCTTVNEVDQNTEDVWYNHIEKGGKFLKYVVDAAVWAIGLLKGQS